MSRLYIPRQPRCTCLCQVATTRDVIWKILHHGRPFPPFPHRVIFMQVFPKFFRDYAGGFRPVCWILDWPSPESRGISTNGTSWNILMVPGIAEHSRLLKFTPNLATQSSRVRRASSRVPFAKLEVTPTFTSTQTNYQWDFDVLRAAAKYLADLPNRRSTWSGWAYVEVVLMLRSELSEPN